MSAVQVTEVESGSPVQSSRTQWTWASPDAPLRINLSLQMISRLRADLERSLDQNSSENELGGVLLGRANRTPATLDILDYAVLPPAADSAGSYCLDIAQLDRLRRKRGELYVVGYFRTQPDGALHLRRPEVNIISDHFRGATDVVLLIRTIPPFRAGFLFWDGEAFVQFSVQDFPFDATALVQESPEPQKAAIKIDGMRDDPTIFPAITEPVVPLRTPVEATSAPRKTVPVHRNMVAAGIAAMGVIGLSLLFWNDPPWASRPRPKPASPEVVAHKVQAPVPPPLPVQAKGAPLNKKDARPPIPPGAKPVAVPPRGAAPLTAATAVKPPAPVARAVPPPATPTAPPLTPQPASSTSRSSTSAPAASSPVVFPPIAEPAPPPPSTPASAPVVSTTPAGAVKESPANPPTVAPALTLPTPPVPKEVAAPKKEDAAVTPAPPAPIVRPPTPSRYAGGWSYPLNNGLFHGSQPEIVEVTIQESNGRLTGSAYARFRVPNERPRSMRFQFSGPVRAGRTQAFNMETADGLKGTIELIPGPNPNLLELNFQTNPENGNGDSGNMILIKK